MWNLLERRGVLPPPHTAGAVDGADLAAGIAVATTVGHTLSPWVRIVVHVVGLRGTRHGRRHSGAGAGDRRHPVGVG